jgi:hypothetical protein
MNALAFLEDPVCVVLMLTICKSRRLYGGIFKK